MKKFVCIIILLSAILLMAGCKTDSSAPKTELDENVNSPADKDSAMSADDIQKDDGNEEVFYDASKLIKPENAIIKAKTFEVKIPEEIADKIYYTVCDTGVDLFFKEDIGYYYDEDRSGIVCRMPRLCTISEDKSVWRLISPVLGEWVLGDEDDISELNSYIQSVLAQVCVLSGGENSCPRELIVGEDGIIHGSMMTSRYLEWLDMLDTDKHTYYIIGTQTDVKINDEEKVSEYNNIRALLIRNSEIMK